MKSIVKLLVGISFGFGAAVTGAAINQPVSIQASTTTSYNKLVKQANHQLKTFRHEQNVANVESNNIIITGRKLTVIMPTGWQSSIHNQVNQFEGHNQIALSKLMHLKNHLNDGTLSAAQLSRLTASNLQLDIKINQLTVNQAVKITKQLKSDMSYEKAALKHDRWIGQEADKVSLSQNKKAYQKHQAQLKAQRQQLEHLKIN